MRGTGGGLCKNSNKEGSRFGGLMALKGLGRGKEDPKNEGKTAARRENFCRHERSEGSEQNEHTRNRERNQESRRPSPKEEECFHKM